MDFDTIYETYFSDVYRYIRRLSGSEQIAEEITSETFFKAMQSIQNFRGECDLRVWLCQIAKNGYFSSLKKNEKLVSMEDLGPRGGMGGREAMEEQVADKEEAEQLRKLLHTLSEPYREVFLWRVFAELSFQQIGEIFSKTDNWACVTYHRARAMLKRKWEETYRET